MKRLKHFLIFASAERNGVQLILSSRVLLLFSASPFCFFNKISGRGRRVDSVSAYYAFCFFNKISGRGRRVDSVSAYYAGGLPIESQQPTSATYVTCRECNWPPCWPLYSQQVSYRRWISGIHGTQVTKHTSEGSTLALKPKGDVIRSPKQGYQWPHKKDSCPPKFILKKNIPLVLPR